MPLTLGAPPPTVPSSNCEPGSHQPAAPPSASSSHPPSRRGPLTALHRSVVHVPSAGKTSKPSAKTFAYPYLSLPQLSELHSLARNHDCLHCVERPD